MTDITLDLCIIKASGTKIIKASGPKIIKPDYSFSTPKFIPEPDFNSQNGINYITHNLLNNVTELLILSTDPNFINAGKSINQFSKLTSGKFKSYDALKMANLDALTGITKHIHGVLIPKTYQPDLSALDIKEDRLLNPIYVDFYGAPGGYSEYLLWKFPTVVGIGFNPRSNDWKLDLLQNKELDSLNSFTRMYSGDQDGTGNIRDDEFAFPNAMVEKVAPLGIDFMIGNGNLEIPDTVLEILYGVIMLKTGGDLLIKLNNSWDKVIVDTIYICSLIFESIELIKPVTSEPSNFERYLYCKHKRTDIDDLSELLNALTENTPLFQNLPADFELWLRKMNDLLINKQLAFLRDIIKVMNGESIKVVDVDLDKALMVWGL